MTAAASEPPQPAALAPLWVLPAPAPSTQLAEPPLHLQPAGLHLQQLQAGEHRVHPSPLLQNPRALRFQVPTATRENNTSCFLPAPAVPGLSSWLPPGLLVGE